ncbi:MAG: nucleotidyltransferase domain-containing protein [Patescibacteria group bacterium]|nr:nucleotidyltransferase domain-containing protein [Patescibacteria group bacterium]
MSKNIAQDIAQKYVDKLRDENFSFSEVYLFGSQVKGDSYKWSDIDIAIITDEIKEEGDKKRLKLWKMREKIDDRIEPHPITIDEFEQDWSPLVYEIKNTGIKVV